MYLVDLYTTPEHFDFCKAFHQKRPALKFAKGCAESGNWECVRLLKDIPIKDIPKAGKDDVVIWRFGDKIKREK